MRIDIDKCQDIELLRHEAWRLELVIQANLRQCEGLTERHKEYTDRLNSEDFRSYMELSIYSAMCTHHGNDRDFEESLCKDLSEVVIQVIKGD